MNRPQPVVVVSEPSSAATLIHPILAAGHRVRAVASIDAWCDECSSAGPQCVVIDVAAGEDAVLNAAAWSRLREHGAATVIVYGGNDLRFVVRAMQEGAVDLLPAPAGAAALVAAVAQAVAKSTSTYSHAQHAVRARTLLARCTPRERSIVVHVSRGLRNKTIAHDLACKESTVKVHRSRAMRKLGLGSLAELIRLVELADSAPVTTPDGRPPHGTGRALAHSPASSFLAATNPGG